MKGELPDETEQASSLRASSTPSSANPLMAKPPGSARRVTSQILLHLLGAIGGYGAVLLGIPLPWLIGALFVAAIAKLTVDWEEPPIVTRRVGQIVVASSVGFYLTPEAFAEVLQSAAPILLSAGYVIVVGSLIGIGQAVLGGFDRATSMFSCIPGGPTEMATMAEAHGGDAGSVAIAQALRIVAIVCIIPPLLFLSGGAAAPPPLTLAQNASLLGLPITLGIGTLFALLAGLTGIMNVFFLGPMIGIGGLTAAGIHLPPIPDPVVYGAQVLLGVSLGCFLRREIFGMGLRFFVTLFLTTGALLGMCAGLAALFAILFRHDLFTMLLANAPGSVTEMSLTAQMLNRDVALVAAFHMVRIVLLMLTAPLIYALVRRW